MSLLPALLAMVTVVLAAAGAASMVRDGGLAAAQHIDHQLARAQAEAKLRRVAASLREPNAAAAGRAIADPSITIDAVPSSGRGEIGDLPLQIVRVTAASAQGRSLVRLQADYAVDGCESVHDDPCMSRVRRIAWRELPAE